MPPPRHGPEDSPLTETGHAQAMRLGERMRAFRGIFSEVSENDGNERSTSVGSSGEKSENGSDILFVSSPLTRAPSAVLHITELYQTSIMTQ